MCGNCCDERAAWHQHVHTWRHAKQPTHNHDARARQPNMMQQAPAWLHDARAFLLRAARASAHTHSHTRERQHRATHSQSRRARTHKHTMTQQSNYKAARAHLKGAIPQQPARIRPASPCKAPPAAGWVKGKRLDQASAAPKRSPLQTHAAAYTWPLSSAPFPQLARCEQDTRAREQVAAILRVRRDENKFNNTPAETQRNRNTHPDKQQEHRERRRRRSEADQIHLAMTIHVPAMGSSGGRKTGKQHKAENRKQESTAER